MMGVAGNFKVGGMDRHHAFRVLIGVKKGVVG
jgi:hypothetical protein